MNDVAIAAGLRSAAAQLLAGTPTEKGVGLDLLTQADVLDPPAPPKLTYLGPIRMPKEVPQFSTGAFTLRKSPAGGAPTGWVIGHIGAAQSLYQITLPTPTGQSLPNAPRAALVSTIPGALLAGRTWPLGNDLNHLPIRGVYCTSGDQLLALYSSNYNVSDGKGYPAWMLINNLDAATPLVTGPFNVPNAQNNRVSGYALELPDYLDVLTGGNRLACGAGIVSGSSSCSFGPDLWATDITGGAGVPLVDYPQAERCYRDANYVVLTGTGTTTVIGGVTYHVYAPSQTSTGQFELPVNGHGYWSTVDWVGGATWCGNGALFCGSRPTGYVWYGEGTIAVQTGSTPMLPGLPPAGTPASPAAPLVTNLNELRQLASVPVYTLVKACNPNSKGQGGQQDDPANPNVGYRASMWWYPNGDLVAVALGRRQPADLTPALIDPYAPGMALDCQKDLTGLAYDPTTKQLYAGCPKADNGYPVVHVWSAA